MDKIEIQGYKSIQDQTITFGPINLLVGANGSGKSNLLSFFTFIRNLYSRNLQAFVSLNGGMDAFLFRGRKVTEQMSAKLSFPNSTYSLKIKAGQDKFVITEEKISEAQPTPAQPQQPDAQPTAASNTRDIASFAAESNLQFDTTPQADYLRNSLREMQKYHFYDTGDKSPFTNVSNIETGIHYLYSRGENLAAFLYGIRKDEPKYYARIVAVIQSVAPYFRDFLLKPDREGNLTLLWEDKFGVVYNVHDLSDGTIRFIALTTLFMQPNLPQTIIIDEPELGLHPRAIDILAGMIKSAANRGCQVIAATQSTDLISCFEPEDILVVDQKDGASIYQRLSSKGLEWWLEEFSLGDLWRRNIISGGQPQYLRS